MSDKKDAVANGDKQLAGVAKVAAESQGLYNVTFLEDHGNNKKDSTTKMHHSTAKALEYHKIVKIGEKVKVVEKPKR